MHRSELRSERVRCAPKVYLWVYHMADDVGFHNANGWHCDTVWHFDTDDTV